MAGISLNSSLLFQRVPHLASIYRCIAGSRCPLIYVNTQTFFTVEPWQHMSPRQCSPRLSVSHKLTGNCKRGKNKSSRLRVYLTEEVRLCSQQNERCERRNRVSVKWRHNSIVLIDCTCCHCHSNTTTSELVKPCQKTFQQR